MYRILLVVLALVPGYLFAQGNFVLRNYTAVHGVPQSQINGMMEDDNGYLWLATYGGGVARFDGQDFKIYTTLDGLLNNTVYDLKIDNEQNIWAVHPQGLSRFDGTSFKTFEPEANSVNRNTVRRAMVFEDTVLVLSAPGRLGKIYKDSVYYWNRSYQPDAFIHSMFQFESGKLCIVMSDKRIFIKSPEGDRLVGSLPGDHTVYSGYRENGNLKLQSYSMREKKFMTHEVNLKNLSFQTVVNNSENTILLSDSIRQELWMRDKHNNLIKENTLTSDRETILTNRAVNSVMRDREGNTWIGSNGAGLYKYYHLDFTRIGTENLVGVMSVMQDDDVLWLGSMNHGLWRLENNTQTHYGGNREILCITKTPDGVVWAGGMDGMGRYINTTDKLEWFSVEDGLAGDIVFSIQPDEHGNLWIATNNGVSFYDGKKFTNYHTEDGLLANRVNSAYYSKRFKTLFMGNELGMNTFSNGRIEELTFAEFKNTTILSINPYRDSLLLVGSGGAGFSVYDPVRKTSRLITTHDGLASDFIYFIASDDDHVIWVGTEKGIGRLKLDEQLNITENIHFDHENGLAGVEANQNAFSLRGDGRFFGLIDGAYRFNESVTDNLHAFDVHLTDVEIYYGQESSRKYADLVTGSFKIPHDPKFPHNKNHITFSFNRVDKRNPKSVKFKYILSNYDDAWSKPSATRQVTYSNLPPGRYEFVVMATDHQGSWSPNVLRYPFFIRAAFYQTAAFWIVVFLLLAGVCILFLYLRVRHKIEQAMLREKIRLHEQEHLRKEIARDFHDEMGNQLTRIINYVSLLKLNGSVTGGSSQADLYTKVENSAKYLYTGTRDFIWSIDPVNDELSKLFIHIRDFGEKLFEEKDIKFRAFNDVKTDVRLPYGFSREANLIFKEAMTNTFKSSQAKNATFSLFSRENGFEFLFEDDGIGCNVEEKKPFGGLKNIRERAEKIKAILTIASEPGNGTRISLKFQFDKKSNYVSVI